MGFADFLGNEAVTRPLRAAIAAGRLPHGLILTGPEGSGKYTLTLMLARALNCQRQPRDADGLADFCGECGPCVRIAQAEDLPARIAEAVTARDDMRDTDKRETRVLVQTDPDVLVVPPDPPQNLIKVGQVRTVIAQSNRVPSGGGHRCFIFTSAAFMKEAANALLKALEEPGAQAHFFLDANHTGELLATIRSRCAMFRLAAVAPEELTALLAQRRPELPAAQRALVVRLAQGAVGRALTLDVAAYQAARADALTILRASLQGEDHTPLFKATETYRAGAEGQEKTTAMLRAMGSVLEDMLLLSHGAPELVRNIDLETELGRLAGTVSFEWIESAMRGLDQVESGMRRNLLRSLSLDALATTLERA